MGLFSCFRWLKVGKGGRGLRKVMSEFYHPKLTTLLPHAWSVLKSPATDTVFSHRGLKKPHTVWGWNGFRRGFRFPRLAVILTLTGGAHHHRIDLH